ncbi:thioredoxin [Aphanothece sacrum]|uniref:Thioredoxin n=1 Tax=Aphanothece sacrum FPU1 TaxID=1920663 RepID=A0A401IFP9_APHSA|nr:thioredoxin [Aphanothece sacrum]GBF80113.1 thioredoxin [Aphanothece sacrum FPU1]GBF86049.1 thioredoxin [Aphanothece sacrum FPU3]
MAKASFIQTEDFEQLLIDSLPLVVDYTATWCGPCRVISPFIDQLAEMYEGRANVVKIDIDQNKDNAKKYGIRSIPAVLIFKDGEVVETLVGKAPYETFSQALEKHLSTMDN